MTTSHRNADFADLRQQAGILRLLALLLAGLGVAAGCQGGLGWLVAVAAALLAVGCWQVADHRSALSARAAQAAQDIETLIRRRVGQ